MTSSMIVRRRKTQSRIIRHRTAVIRSSYDHHATLIYTTIVRCRTIYLCFSFSPSNHSEVVHYDYRSTVVRCSTISQTLSMCRKPIVSGVTTKLRLQNRSRIGENFRNLRCRPSHDVAAQCDQGFIQLDHDKKITIIMD